MKCIICITSYKKGGTADLFALFMRDHGEGVSFFQGYGNGAGRPVLSADENNRLLCRWQMAGMAGCRNLETRECRKERVFKFLT